MRDFITKPVYKYIKREYAELMIQSGAIQIGTLAGFRNMESTGDVRGDAGEGVKITTSEPGKVTYASGSAVHQALRAMGISVDGGISTNGEQCLVHEQIVRNAFVYCVSEDDSLELRDRFGALCVEIREPVTFFNLVNSALREHLSGQLVLRDGLLDRCVYTDRRRPWTKQHEVHPCLIKPQGRGFEVEREVRAFWDTGSHSIEPQIIYVPGVIPLLRIV